MSFYPGNNFIQDELYDMSLEVPAFKISCKIKLVHCEVNISKTFISVGMSDNSQTPTQNLNNLMQTRNDMN